ncbi:NAD(P)-binding protein [Pholiota conissans]|uniref:NAD(P)-binding protein n=1 Tax=Pholiota conissans TaxID=109636 RepID=A0A9P5YUP8_9AGAR|nr:NAD(P)-binding protein [Pholiota conissans]
MSNSSANIYFVAGATRGIGLALVAEIAAKDPSAIVYAGGRNPSGSPQLVEIGSKYPGRVELVKYVSAHKEGNDALAKEISKKHGHIDTVIANAAIAKSAGKIHETISGNYEECFSVNVVGPIVLFQAFRDLLKASALPRFVAISSGAGSIGMMDMIPMDTSSYGTSKAALNWVVRKIHFENEWLIAYPQCPGAVDTDMSKQGRARDTTGKMAEVIKQLTLRQPAEAARILVNIMQESTREKDGGQFHNIDNGRYLW